MSLSLETQMCIEHTIGTNESVWCCFFSAALARAQTNEKTKLF